MYELVYYAGDSRIAEKMLEKAILMCKDVEEIKDAFTLDGFLGLDDEHLLSLVEKAGTNSQHLLAVRETKRLYETVYERELKTPDFEITPEFLSSLENQCDELSDKLSLELNRSYGKEDYRIICDIVRSRVPEEVFLDETDEYGQEVVLHQKSDVIRAIKGINVIKIYAEQETAITLKEDKEELHRKLKELVGAD
jgi:HD superfamily phosphohydrolase